MLSAPYRCRHCERGEAIPMTARQLDRIAMSLRASQ
jgi:hypothetical protein